MLGLILSFLPTFLVKAFGFISDAAKSASDAIINDRNAVRDERLQRSRERMAVNQNAKEIRLATAGYWEQRFLAFIVGVIPIMHWAAIGIGSTFAAPFKAMGQPVGWLEWTLHVPPMPPPFDQYEGPILLSFYGLVGVLGASQKIAGAIAIRRRQP